MTQDRFARAKVWREERDRSHGQSEDRVRAKGDEPASDREAAPGAGRLWAVVDLPFLALEALSIDAAGYAVVVESSPRGKIVCAASESARSAGIRPGMHVNAALAMCGGLQVRARDHDAERTCLYRLRRWARRYTPTVSTEPPARLLFEISASLRLFGGAGALHDRLRRGLGRSGHRCRLAITPTPGASSVLSAAGREVLITTTADLRASMQGLPVRLLGLTEQSLRRLRAAGIVFMEELWRLPRHDLARRFGPEVVRRLDQVLGAHPDPRRVDSPEARFERCFELEAETADAGLVLRAARVLLEQFAGFLAAGSAVAGDVQVVLEHGGRPATRIGLGTRLPERDAGRWERLLGEHLGRRELNAMVTGIRLSGVAVPDAAPVCDDLFLSPDTSREWVQVLDELEARLGKKCLWVPETAADHRPERAWRKHPPGYRGAGDRIGPDRPLWLLRRPQWLSTRLDGTPGRGGIAVTGGAERIESGWWDDNEYCRDYYTAICPRGRRLWIFRDLKQESGWYLHGLFG